MLSNLRRKRAGSLALISFSFLLFLSDRKSAPLGPGPKEFVLPVSEKETAHMFPRAVVTGASENHFDVFAEFLENFQQFNPTRIPLVFYALNLRSVDISWLKTSHPWVHIYEFNFAEYPAYFNVDISRGEYAWKPIIVKEVLDTLALSVLWLDSGDRLTKPTALQEVFHIIEAEGYVTTKTSGTTQIWVHPGTLRYLNASDMESKMCNGAIVGFSRLHSNMYKDLVKPWAECALIRECIAPSGSSRRNHRQDQAVLTVLLNKNGYPCKFKEGQWVNGQMIPGELNIQLQQDSQTRYVRRELDEDVCGGEYDSDQRREIGLQGMSICKANTLGQEPVILHRLLGNPDLQAGGREPPIIKLDMHLPQYVDQATMTVVMSVYNSAGALAASLPALFTTMKGAWELVIILDACYDESYDVSKLYLLRHFKESSCVRARIIEQPTAIWETSSDNLGMVISNPKKSYTLVQADNVMTEVGWNVRMQELLDKHQEFIAIGGRCGHSRDETMKIGRCGADVGEPLPENVDMLQFHIRETVNRGPLLIRSTYVQELGFFDENRYYLGDDDHDLFFRAAQRNFKVAYLPVGSVAPMELRAQNRVNNITPSKIQEQERSYKLFREKRASKYEARGDSGRGDV